MLNKKETAGETAMQVFTFKENDKPIRVEVVDGDAWFVAKDVCDALGIGNNRNATARLDDDEMAASIVRTPAGERQMTTVSESGMYNLIFQSRKPEARKFRKWVTSEVLPSIRRTGRYEAVAAPQQSGPGAVVSKGKVSGSLVHKPAYKNPKAWSAEMSAFYDELYRWVTRGDEEAIAELAGVKRDYVHSVLRGQCASYNICVMLVDYAKANRKKGVQREAEEPKLTGSALKQKMAQLRFDFMEGGE